MEPTAEPTAESAPVSEPVAEPSPSQDSTTSEPSPGPTSEPSPASEPVSEPSPEPSPSSDTTTSTTTTAEPLDVATFVEYADQLVMLATSVVLIGCVLLLLLSFLAVSSLRR